MTTNTCRLSQFGSVVLLLILCLMMDKGIGASVSCTSNAQCASLGDQCNTFPCNTAAGVCATTPTPRTGEPCNSNPSDICVTSQVCNSGGSCVTNTYMDCSDGNPCTQDTCVMSGGTRVCSNPPAPGASCSDGDPCSTGDTCNGAGQCSAGRTSPCQSSVCTLSQCQVLSSTTYSCTSIYNSDPCDDANSCTTSDTCSSGVCSGAPLNCDDGYVSTIDTCSAGVCYHAPVMNDVRAWGTNLTAGGSGNVMGTGSVTTATSPTPVSGLAGKFIKSIASKKFVTLAVANDSTVWGTGANNDGELGLSVASTTTFKQVPGLPTNASQVSVAVGEKHSLVLVKATSSSNMVLYGMGSNQYRQIGINNNVASYSTPTAIPFPTSFWTASPFYDIIAVGAGFAHSVAITSASIYTWGQNQQAQCGTNGTTGTANYVNTPTAIDNSLILSTLFHVPIDFYTGLSVGYTSNLVWTQNDRVFVWGGNANGELGVGSVGPINNPTEVLFPMGVTIVGGSVMQNSSLVLFSNGNVYISGRVPPGLGLGNTPSVSTFTLITFPSGTGTIVGISVGYQSMMFWTASRAYWAGSMNGVTPTTLSPIAYYNTTTTSIITAVVAFGYSLIVSSP